MCLKNIMMLTKRKSNQNEIKQQNYFIWDIAGGSNVFLDNKIPLLSRKDDIHVHTRVISLLVREVARETTKCRKF